MKTPVPSIPSFSSVICVALPSCHLVESRDDLLVPADIVKDLSLRSHFNAASSCSIVSRSSVHVDQGYAVHDCICYVYIFLSGINITRLQVTMSIVEAYSCSRADAF